MASIKKRADGIWRARYRDEAGKEHARHFVKKAPARKDGSTRSQPRLSSGSYADPKAGPGHVRSVLRRVVGTPVWAPGTVLAMSLSSRSVPFGDRADEG